MEIMLFTFSSPRLFHCWSAWELVCQCQGPPASPSSRTRVPWPQVPMVSSCQSSWPVGSRLCLSLLSFAPSAGTWLKAQFITQPSDQAASAKWPKGYVLLLKEVMVFEREESLKSVPFPPSFSFPPSSLPSAWTPLRLCHCPFSIAHF